MEFLVASAIGILTAGGIYLVLRLRTFPVILGISLLTYAVNVFLFTSGRLTIAGAPILRDGVTHYADPLPQALVLTPPPCPSSLPPCPRPRPPAPPV